MTADLRAGGRKTNAEWARAMRNFAITGIRLRPAYGERGKWACLMAVSRSIVSERLTAEHEHTAGIPPVRNVSQQ